VLLLLLSAAQASDWTLSVAADRGNFWAPTTWDETWGLSLRASAWPERLEVVEVEVEAGLRRLFQADLEPLTAFEVWGAARLAPSEGTWRPGVGVQLGLTGGVLWDEAQRWGEGYEVHEYVERGWRNPVYGGFTVLPARFVLRERWLVSAMEIELGATSLGRLSRIQISPLSLGVAR
jgi:hypothetical protein